MAVLRKLKHETRLHTSSAEELEAVGFILVVGQIYCTFALRERVVDKSAGRLILMCRSCKWA
jgi:hypothetical protein